MYVAREVTEKSYEDIGNKIAGRHYSTALYACKEVSDLMAKDSKERETIQTIIKNLKSPK